MSEPSSRRAPDSAVVVVRAPTDIALAREATLRVCAAVGLGEDKANVLALAVSEATTNALQHGGGQAVLRVIGRPTGVMAEVTDRGNGFEPADPGQPAPGPHHDRGRGLWLVEQLVDDVEVRTGPYGTRVRMTINH